jgi:hypothetical protein
MKTIRPLLAFVLLASALAVQVEITTLQAAMVIAWLVAAGLALTTLSWREIAIPSPFVLIPVLAFAIRLPIANSQPPLIRLFFVLALWMLILVALAVPLWGSLAHQKQRQSRSARS